MVTLEELEYEAERGGLNAFLLPVDAGLANWPEICLNEGHAIRFSHGNPVQVDQQEPGSVRVCGVSGMLLGLGEVEPGGRLKPIRVFALG
jgi:tRNA pseudouridine55 synthase